MQNRKLPIAGEGNSAILPFTALTGLSLVVFVAAPAFAQIDPKTALLERAAWDALVAGQPHAAADAPIACPCIPLVELIASRDAAGPNARLMIVVSVESLRRVPVP